jgi:hypothetical protein
MEQHYKKHSSTDEIFQSIEGMQRAEAPDFFYTRLMGRIQEPVTKAAVWIKRPVLVFATLLLLLAMNIAAITQFNKRPEPSKQLTGIQGFASQYGLDGSSSYQDKNAQ